MRSRWRSPSISEPARAAAAVSAAVMFALAAVLSGCGALEALRETTTPKSAEAQVRRAPPAPASFRREAPPSRIAFSHKFHLGRGPTCDDCHEDTAKSEKAPMPKVEFCMDCHTEIDEKKPAARTVAAFLAADGATPIWSRVTAEPPDVVFSHARHLAQKIECAECHRGIEESEAVSGALFVDMDACVACHEAKSAKNGCDACHRGAAANAALGKGPWFAPPNHDAAWRGAHGSVASLGAPRVRAERCDDCHARDAFPAASRCDACHAATRPADHDAAWRGAHGPLVAGDPARTTSCAVCHGSGSFPEASRCDACHVSTRPADHDRAWTKLHGEAVRRAPGDATGRCAFCHEAREFPAESRCATCHLTEAPRDHSQAWRTGGGHGLAAALDRARCEACHTADTCAACHAAVSPRNHRAGWGGSRNRHCVNCHFPLSSEPSESCGVCHDAAPSHARAPRMPASPPHAPDQSCRKCHADLRHADNGTSCVVCHR